MKNSIYAVGYYLLRYAVTLTDGHRYWLNEYNSIITNSVDIFIIYYPRDIIIRCGFENVHDSKKKSSHTKSNDITIIIIQNHQSKILKFHV